MTISFEDAKALAVAYLSNKGTRAGCPLGLLDSETLEKPFGWVFFYNSKEYIETGKFSAQLAGNAPFVVLKQNGEIRETGTAYPLEHYLRAFE